MQPFEKKHGVGSMLTGQPSANVPAAVETPFCAQGVWDQEGRGGRSITRNSYTQAVMRHFLFPISS